MIVSKGTSVTGEIQPASTHGGIKDASKQGQENQGFISEYLGEGTF